jgi:hypothetical protein
MDFGRSVAIAIWAATLVPSVVFPPHFAQPTLVGSSAFILLLPFVVFTAGAFWVRAYPFDFVPLRVWADKKWGQGAYAGFVRKVKPVLLVGVLGIGAGASGSFQAYRAHFPAGAYWEAEFLLSMGAGVLVARIVLARRGLLIESRSASGVWANRSFLPLAIRRIRATNLTAAMTGIWTALGMKTAEAFFSDNGIGASTHGGFRLGALMIFFFIPVFLFVIGIHDHQNREFRSVIRDFGRVAMRMLFWMFGSMVVFVGLFLSRLMSP